MRCLINLLALILNNVLIESRSLLLEKLYVSLLGILDRGNLLCDLGDPLRYLVDYIYLLL